MQVNIVTDQFKDLITKAKKVLILIGGDVDADTVSAGLALQDLLKSRSVDSHLVSEGSLPSELSVLSGSEQIKNNLEPKNLVISFNYAKNPIEKISYKIDGDTLNLIVKPRMGGISLDEVQTSFVGGDYNIIVLLGISEIEDSKNYTYHKDLFESLPTINIDINENNSQFGKLNIIDQKIGSLCALLTIVFTQANIKLPQKGASLLLTGIKEATQNYTKVKNSKVFEAAAYATKAKESEQEEVSTKSGLKEHLPEEESDMPKDWLSPKIYRSSKVS